MPIQSRMKSDAAAVTSSAITDNSGGTETTTLLAIGATFDQTDIADNFATLATEYNKLRADLIELRGKFNDGQ